MDMKLATEQLRQLQSWRNQLVGIGLLPPDVSAVLKFVEEDETKVRALSERRVALEDEVSRLGSELASRRREGEREIAEAAAALKADLDGQLAPLQERVARARKAAEEAERVCAEKDKFYAARAAQLDAELRAKVGDLEKASNAYEEFRRKAGLA